ncbi:helix-turn-helix domain-containing protein [Mesorhizobium sp. CO1-1-8]|uniref:helix-turn-helix domain-containing protein n=1 Tax=Mesorhizobium sp. CO1-1-8 TaxID=2876631 RepID=UPI001CD10C03|nr:type II toxin-antitoxin system HigA family antitoxin [Mesorhizobium sp. CO1-1-8]MBZ9775327.1 type II toxin-antitoxin system HigA family antitoxin [Mesorhizobium sp. CO1-1-8]
MENIRPIKTEADYDWAIAEITRYFESEPEVGTPDGDRFDVLATLIEAYEDEHYPIEAPDPVEAIRSHMALFNLSRKALAEVIGSSPRATEVLNRKRALTLDMVFKLNKEWNIPAEVLVQPYHLAHHRERKRA